MKGQVQVYRNLNQTLEDGTKVYSVKNDKGIVVDHVTEIALSRPIFRVGPKGNQRVRDEKRKNVHAYVVGKFHDINFDKAQYFPYGYKFAQAFYNPYKVEKFVDFHSGEALEEAARVVCKKAPDGEMNIYYANPFEAMKNNKVYT